MMGVGIDFGTSNSSVAIYDGREVRYLDLDSQTLSAIMPTALYLDRARSATVGQAAIERYLRDNAGRVVELTAEEVGTIEITVAGTDSTVGPKSTDGALTTVVEVHAFTDRDLPGRLFRSLKRWLADAKVERVRVFDGRYRLVALVTPILARVRAVLDAAGLHPGPGEIRVGRPVAFEGSAGSDAVAVARLREACDYAELRDVHLYPEPVAAALSYAHDHPREPGEVLLSFDFGGGTLDLCAMRTLDRGFEILGTHGIALGGDMIDQLIYRNKVFPALGDGCLMDSRTVTSPGDVPFPFREFGEKLLNWQLAYELNTPERRELIHHGMAHGADSRERLGRLADVVVHNQTYRVVRAVERAKVALSRTHDAEIDVPELDLTLSITRREFEAMIAEPLRRIESAIDTTLARCALRPEDVGAVVCTGGSSRIPVVRRTIADRLRAPIVEHGTFTSIAAGLAIASYHGHAWASGRTCS